MSRARNQPLPSPGPRVPEAAPSPSAVLGMCMREPDPFVVADLINHCSGEQQHDLLCSLHQARGNQFVEQVTLALTPTRTDPAAADPATADPHARLLEYEQAAHHARAHAVRAQALEHEWADQLGMLGHAITAFDNPRPPPARWTALIAKWQLLGDQVHVIANPGPEIQAHATAVATTAMIHQFRELTTLDQQTRDAFLQYLDHYASTAGSVSQVVLTIRDLALLGAASVGAILALPTITGLATTGVAATGLTGTSATVATTTLTYGGAGLVGGAVDGAMRMAPTLFNEMSDMRERAEQAGQRALTAQESIDWHRIGADGWLGMKRGFVNAVMGLLWTDLTALAMSPIDRYLAAKLTEEQLGKLLREALAGAIAGTATGAVVVALREGLHAVLAGESFDVIVDAMERGFTRGAMAGAAEGAVYKLVPSR